MRKVCVQDIENISSCSFCVYPVVPIKLGKVIKYEAKQIIIIYKSNIYLETLNIEWGQIDPKHNRRVKKTFSMVKVEKENSMEIERETERKWEWEENGREREREREKEICGLCSVKLEVGGSAVWLCCSGPTVITGAFLCKVKVKVRCLQCLGKMEAERRI